MNNEKDFEIEVSNRISKQISNNQLKAHADAFLTEGLKSQYIYNFSWLGRPIIQTPQDLIALQEIIFKVKPDLIIDVGVARGGSLIYFASILELVAIYGGNKQAKVLGVEIDLKDHNRQAIFASPLSAKIKIIDGSSIDPSVVNLIQDEVSKVKTVLVCLDSLHTHKHVFSELMAYSNFVSLGSYCIVFDTSIEGQKDELFSDRPWKSGDSPGSAVEEFLKRNKDFLVDEQIDGQLVITMNKRGYLKRVK